MAEQKANVATTSVAYDAMAEKWCLTDDLHGGTFTMRAARSKWLPQEPKESDPAYSNRLGRSFLYPKYDDTVNKLGDKPFSKPVTIVGKLPAPIDKIESNVDNSGSDITQFCRAAFTSAIDRGIVHILVDYPTVPLGSTLADERRLGARPTFVVIDASNLIAWKSKRMPNGSHVLTQIRIRECSIESVGAYEDQEVELVRVINYEDGQGTWELWQEDKEDKDNPWKKIQSGTHSFPGIPLVTVYLNRTGFMTASPPMYNLAELNLAHWQSYSDQRNCLRFARVGLLFGKGLSEDQLTAGITIGPSHFIGTTSEKADLKYVEHTGAAIEIGRTDLKDLENEMEIVGAQPLMEKASTKSVSATGRSIDEGRTQSAIQSWVHAMENGLIAAYQAAATWTGTTIDDKTFKIEIFSEFILSQRPVEEAQALTLALEKGGITRATFLNELKRRGILSDVVETEEEVKALEAEDVKKADNALKLKSAGPAPTVV